MHTTQAIMLAALGLLSTVNAHMKIASPVPYGKSNLDNSPLADDGSDFPCKQRPGVYEDEGALAANQMVIGAPQTLSFLGGATHGGGSCQISLTEDKEPTKDSTWKVIHSIEGGCPFASEGNLNDDASGTGSTDFSYKIPDGIAPGQYTLAWTWFNRIGNREMYMNCAPINVLAGGAAKRNAPMSRKRQSNFPNMFVANIGNGCTTVETENVKFPDPGESVEIAGPLPAQPLVCPGQSAAPSNAGEFKESSVEVVPVGGSSTPAPVAPQTPVASPKPSTAVASPKPAPAVVSARPAPVVTGTSPAPATGNSSSNTAGGCTAPGESICSPDGTQIGTCDASNRVTFVNVAPGTVCKDGFMVASRKRSAKFAHGHVRRGHSLGKWM